MSFGNHRNDRILWEIASSLAPRNDGRLRKIATSRASRDDSPFYRDGSATCSCHCEEVRRGNLTPPAHTSTKNPTNIAQIMPESVASIYNYPAKS